MGIHVVSAGDTPQRIAESYTGNWQRFPELVAANPRLRRQWVVDPITGVRHETFLALDFYPGQTLYLPLGWTTPRYVVNVVSAPTWGMSYSGGLHWGGGGGHHGGGGHGGGGGHHGGGGHGGGGGHHGGGGGVHGVGQLTSQPRPPLGGVPTGSATCTKIAGTCVDNNECCPGLSCVAGQCNIPVKADYKKSTWAWVISGIAIGAAVVYDILRKKNARR